MSYVQALEHSSIAMETAMGGASLLEALQLHGGILKDLKHFEEAETVSFLIRSVQGMHTLKFKSNL